MPRVLDSGLPRGFMRLTVRLALVLVLAVSVAACPSEGPTSPSSNNGSGSGGSSGGGDGGSDDGGGGDDGGDGGGGGGSTGPALSSTTATIDGETYQATEILAPSPDFIEGSTGLRLLSVTTGERTTGLGLAFQAPAEVGTHTTPTIGVQATLMQLDPYGPGELPEFVADLPQWIAIPPLGGSGSVTIDTLTETTATGTFSFMLVPGPPPSTATGNRMASGSFSLTFTDGAELQF